MMKASMKKWLAIGLSIITISNIYMQNTVIVNADNESGTHTDITDIDPEEGESTKKVSLNLNSYPFIDVLMTKGVSDVRISEEDFTNDLYTALEDYGISRDYVNVISSSTQASISNRVFDFSKKFSNLHAKYYGTTSEDNYDLPYTPLANGRVATAVTTDNSVKITGNYIAEGTMLVLAPLVPDDPMYKISKQEYEFNYNLDYGDSITAGGLIIGGEINGDYLDCYVITMNNITSHNHKNTSDWCSLSLLRYCSGGELYTDYSSAYKCTGFTLDNGTVCDKTGAIVKVRYYVGGNRTKSGQKVGGKVDGTMRFTVANNVPGKIHGDYQEILSSFVLPQSGRMNVTYMEGDLSVRVSDDGGETYSEYGSCTGLDSIKDSTYFGYFTEHYTHGCSKTGKFLLEDIQINKEASVDYNTVLTNADEQFSNADSVHVVVNLDDMLSDDFTDETKLAKTTLFTQKNNIHFIQWGTDTNKDVVTQFIENKNNNKGFYADNSDYENCINETAKYIADIYYNMSETGDIVVKETPATLEVTPEEFATNTATGEGTYKYGKWTVKHYSKYYTGNEAENLFKYGYAGDNDKLQSEYADVPITTFAEADLDKGSVVEHVETESKYVTQTKSVMEENAVLGYERVITGYEKREVGTQVTAGPDLLLPDYNYMKSYGTIWVLVDDYNKVGVDNNAWCNPVVYGKSTITKNMDFSSPEELRLKVENSDYSGYYIKTANYDSAAVKSIVVKVNDEAVTLQYKAVNAYLCTQPIRIPTTVNEIIYEEFPIYSYHPIYGPKQVEYCYDNDLSIKQFDDEVGLYEIFYEDELIRTVYEHRKPVASFEVELASTDDKGKGTLEYTNNSFDLDHYYSQKVIDGTDKLNGLSEYKWEWQSIDEDNTWHDGKLLEIDRTKQYYIRLTVTDAEGESAVAMKMISNGLAKPIAAFSFNKSTIQLNADNKATVSVYDSIQIDDESYDPSFLPLTKYSWTVYYREKITDLLTPIVEDVESPPLTFDTTKPGFYYYSLVVENSAGLKSDVAQRTLVVLADTVGPNIEITPLNSDWTTGNVSVNVKIKDDKAGLHFFRYLVIDMDEVDSFINNIGEAGYNTELAREYISWDGFNKYKLDTLRKTEKTIATDTEIYATKAAILGDASTYNTACNISTLIKTTDATSINANKQYIWSAPYGSENSNIIIEGDGRWSLYLMAVDNDGNTNMYSVNDMYGTAGQYLIDSTSPIITNLEWEKRISNIIDVTLTTEDDAIYQTQNDLYTNDSANKKLNLKVNHTKRGSGVAKYAVTDSPDTLPTDSDWQTSSHIQIKKSGTYYFWAKDFVGNISEPYEAEIGDTSYTIDYIYDYEYDADSITVNKSERLTPVFIDSTIKPLSLHNVSTWTTKPDGSGTSLDVGSYYKIDEYFIENKLKDAIYEDENEEYPVIKLYAQFKSGLKLTFNLNNGRYNGLTDNITLIGSIYGSTGSYAFDITGNKAPNIPSKQYEQTDTFNCYGVLGNNGTNTRFTYTDSNGVTYRLLGWSLNKDAKVPDAGLLVYDSNRLSAYEILEDTVLYAVWEPVLEVQISTTRELGTLVNSDKTSAYANASTVTNGESNANNYTLLTAKPGELLKYEANTLGKLSYVDVRFDSLITNMYDFLDSRYSDTLNPIINTNRDEVVASTGYGEAHSALNRHITNVNGTISRKYYLPLYLGSKEAAAASHESREYFVKYTFVNENSLYYRYMFNTNEEVSFIQYIRLPDSGNGGSGSTFISTLDELRVRLKIRVKE